MLRYQEGSCIWAKGKEWAGGKNTGEFPGTSRMCCIQASCSFQHYFLSSLSVLLAFAIEYSPFTDTWYDWSSMRLKRTKWLFYQTPGNLNSIRATILLLAEPELQRRANKTETDIRVLLHLNLHRVALNTTRGRPEAGFPPLCFTHMTTIDLVDVKCSTTIIALH